MAFDTLQEVLNLLRTRYPLLGKRWDESHSLSRWATAVGPQIAKHARALRVVEGVLWIEVDHPIWRAELHARKAQILQKLNSRTAASPIAASTSSEEPPVQDLYFVSTPSGAKK